MLNRKSQLLGFIKCFLILPGIIMVLVSSCDRTGCTDPYASNFEKKAESDDGNCKYDSDPFPGRWSVNDSVMSFGVLQPDQVRIFDIRVQTTNKSVVRFFWKNENGSLSDTLIANATPNTLSIPLQSFGDTLQIQGNFTYSNFTKKLKTEYRFTSSNGYFLQRKGIGVKLN
jgi:hypothetical protein